MTLDQIQDHSPGYCGDCRHWHEDAGRDGHCEQPELVAFALHVHDDDGCNRYTPDPEG